MERPDCLSYVRVPGMPMMWRSFTRGACGWLEEDTSADREKVFSGLFCCSLNVQISICATGRRRTGLSSENTGVSVGLPFLLDGMRAGKLWK
jgi:hypothetical protein